MQIPSFAPPASPGVAATPRDSRSLALLETLLDGMAALYWSPNTAAPPLGGPPRDTPDSDRAPDDLRRGSRSRAAQTRRADADATQRRTDNRLPSQPFHELVAEARQAAHRTAPSSLAPGVEQPASPESLAHPAGQDEIADTSQKGLKPSTTTGTAITVAAPNAKPGDASAHASASRDADSPHAAINPQAFSFAVQPTSNIAAQAAPPPAATASATTAVPLPPTPQPQYAANPATAAITTSKFNVARDVAADARSAQNAHSSSSPENAGENDAAELRVEKLLRLLQGQLARREGRATLRLDPPELGVMTVELRMDRGEIGIHFETDTSLARDLLSTQLDELRQGLEEAGLRVNRLETRLREEPTNPPLASHAALTDERSNSREDASQRQGGRHAHGLTPASAPGQEAAGASEPRDVAVRRWVGGELDSLDLFA